MSLRLAGVVLGLSMVIPACYPGEISSVVQTDLVTTVYDVDAAWGTFQTYAMPDTIIHLTDPDNPEDTLPVSRDCDADILNEVADQMAAIGYTRLAVDTTQVGHTAISRVTIKKSRNGGAMLGRARC